MSNNIHVVIMSNNICATVNSSRTFLSFKIISSPMSYDFGLLFYNFVMVS